MSDIFVYYITIRSFLIKKVKKVEPKKNYLNWIKIKSACILSVLEFSLI